MNTLTRRTNTTTKITCYIKQHNDITIVGLYDPTYDRDQVLMTTEYFSEDAIVAEFIATSKRLGCVDIGFIEYTEDFLKSIGSTQAYIEACELLEYYDESREKGDNYMIHLKKEYRGM